MTFGLCRIAPVGALTAALVVVLATFSGSASASLDANSSVLGAVHKASGIPVKVGLVTDGQSATIDDSSEIPAGQAAAKYINEHLKGIEGHPIQLFTCSDGETPAGATNCGDEMVSDGVVAVLMGESGEAASVYNAVHAGNIPFEIYTSVDSSALTGKGSYVLTNALGELAGPAKLAQQEGAKRAAVVVINLPSASGSVTELDPILYKNVGIPLDIVTVPPGTADMTPQIQAELLKSPDSIAILGDATFCTGAIKALKTLGYKKSIVIIPQCIDSASVASIPGGYAGLKEVTTASTDPNAPEVKLFKSVMATYSPHTKIVDVTSGGYAAVLGFARAMSGLTGAVTPASVEAQFAAMGPETLPLGSGGITFQCNGTAFSAAPAICSSSVLETTLKANGSAATAFKPLNLKAILQL